MTESISKIRRLLEDVILDCDAKWIAFSGGIDSSVIAHIKKDQDINALTIMSKDFVGTDLSYSQIVANHIGIPLELEYVETNDMINAVEKTIAILKNFNDIEIRNSIVSYLYLDILKKKNISKVITGDGADEVFAGYNFLLKKDHRELQNELDRMKKIMHFTSQKIANEFNISIQMPFTDKRILEFADTLSTDLMVNERNGIKFGKWILRKEFENDFPSNVIWRKKTPMQDGSGTSNLTKLFDSIITDDIFTEKIKKIKNECDITIRTKESLYYYEIFRKKFDNPEVSTEKNSCSDCKSEIINHSKFCRMCGKFPLI